MRLPTGVRIVIGSLAGMTCMLAYCWLVGPNDADSQIGATIDGVIIGAVVAFLPVVWQRLKH
jgi:hypothetical protein